jgi:hypothetical protein
LNLEVHGFKLRVINVYAPTDVNGTENQKQTFYRELKKATVKTEKHQKLLIMGDFNATTSIAKSHCCYDGKKVLVDAECNDNGERLKDFCRSHEVGIASTFFKHRMLHRYTWYSNDGKTRKILDYVLAEKYLQKYITDCRVRRGYNFDSDHRLIKTELVTPCTKKARRRYHKITPQPKLDYKILQDPAVKEQFVSTVNEEFKNSTIGDEDPAIKSKKIIDALTSAAEKTLPQTTKSERDNELWKNDTALNEYLAERSKFSLGTTEFKSITKNIKKRVSFLRNEKLRLEAEEINKYASKREVEELFRAIKTDDSTFKNIKRKVVCDPIKLKNHFEKHFNHPIKEDPIELNDIPDFIKKLQDVKPDTIKTIPPDEEEIRKVLTKMKNGKAACDIPAEYFKYAVESKELIDEMKMLLETIWKTLKIPTIWGHSKLISAWKGAAKGSVKDPKAYRGLQIGSSLCKIMIIIIIDRLKPWYEEQLLDQQQGFRSGRGTADGIYITKRVQQITDKMKRAIYVLFVDLSAAFDHIVRKWLFQSIYQRFPSDTDTTLIQLLEALYEYTTTSLKETPDDLFELFLGVRQGGPESPPLYNLIMDYVMRVYMDACEKHGVQFLKLSFRVISTATNREERSAKTYRGNHTVDWSGYADDLELFFDDQKNLEKGLELLNETFERYNLAINVSKTKTMIFNYKYLNSDSSTYPECIVSLNNVPVENVKVFRYLGDDIKFDEPGTGDAEIDLRIAVSEGKFYELIKKLQNHKILLTTRIKILNSMVRSRLTYSCQTWNLTKKQLDKINSAYIGMLRKMVKGGYRRKKGEEEFHYVYTNNDIVRICGTEDIAVFVQRQQKKYLAHLARKPNSSLTKRLLFNSDKYTKPGKQYTLETIVLENERCTADTFYRQALNRKY